MGKQKLTGKLVMIEHEGKLTRAISFPVDELLEGVITDRKRGGIIQRIGQWFRKERMEKTSDAPDEQTTDTGSTAIAQGGFTSLHYYERIRLENRRASRYRDYQRMNAESVLLRRALNVTKNNTFMSRDGDQDSFIIKSENAKVQSVLDDMAKRVELHEMAPKSYRSALMYGDSFEELVFDQAQALMRIKWLNPQFMRRNEDGYGRLMADNAFEMVDAGGEPVAEFAHWQIVHQRHEHERGDLYGTSFFYSSRRSYRILQAMEDGVAINRLQNATDRLVFYVPVPKNIEPQAMDEHIAKVKASFKRRINVDSSGKIDLTKTSLGDDEDIFIGTWENSPAKVERLPSSGIIGNLADLEYFQNDMVTSTGVPKSYLGLERDVNAKSTLSFQDVEFGRSIRSNQKEAAWMVHQVCDRQLAALGLLTDEELYVVEFPSISFIDEEIRATVQNLQWTIAALAKTSMGVPTDWLLTNIIGLPEDDVTKILANLKEPVQPGAASFAGVPTGNPSGRELKRVKEAVFSDHRMVQNLADMRAQLDMVISNQLNQSLAA